MKGAAAVKVVGKKTDDLLGTQGGPIPVSVQIALEALGDLSAIDVGNVSKITQDAMSRYPEHAAEIGIVSVWLIGDMLCPGRCAAASEMRAHLYRVVGHLEHCLEEGGRS